MAFVLASVGALAMGPAAWVAWSGAPGIHRDVAAVPPLGVAIVLGARVYRGGVPSAMLEDRLLAALALYRAGKVRRVLVSGDHGTTAYDEPDAMRQWLVARGVPEQAVFVDHAGFRTLDTMDRAATVFGVRRAVLCTQRFHLPRALFLARRSGIDAVGLVADRRRYAHIERDRAREGLARWVSFVDSYLLGTRARFLGPAIPITGDARTTLDASSDAARKRDVRR